MKQRQGTTGIVVDLGNADSRLDTNKMFTQDVGASDLGSDLVNPWEGFMQSPLKPIASLIPSSADQKPMAMKFTEQKDVTCLLSPACLPGFLNCGR